MIPAVLLFLAKFAAGAFAMVLSVLAAESAFRLNRLDEARWLAFAAILIIICLAVL